MSNNTINNDTPFLNNTLLGLPVMREIFVDPSTSARSDLYAIRQNTETALALQEREREPSVYYPEVVIPDYSDQNEQMIDVIQDVSNSVYEIVRSNEIWFNALNEEVTRAADNIYCMSDTIHNDLGMLHWAVKTIYWSNIPEGKSMNELSQTISEDGKNTALAILLTWWLDKNKARWIFGKKFLGYLKNWIGEIDARAINSNCNSILEDIRQKKEKFYKNEKKIFKENLPYTIAELENQEASIRKSIVSDIDLDYLSRVDQIRWKNLMELVDEWLVNTSILEVMVRNWVVNWEVSDRLSRVIRKDENGEIKPLIELSWVSWILGQSIAQTTLQNIIVRQNATQIGELRQTNNILWNINQGVEQSNNHLVGINDWINIWNWLLWNIDFGIRELNDNFCNFHLEAWELNNNLVSINDWINIWNELQMITNQSLQELIYCSENIANEIALTREVLAWLLNNIGNILVSWFDILQHELRANRQELRTNNMLQSITIAELTKQTQFLTSIQETLRTPGNTRADELTIAWIKAMESNRIEIAQKCFSDALDILPIHIFANYGLAIAMKHNKQDKKAIRHFHIAEDFAINEQKYNIAASALLEQAKIFVKFMNLNKAIMLLEKAAPMDPDNLEILFLQAKILLILKSEKPLEIILNRIFKKIFIEKIIFEVPAWYAIVLSLLNWSVKKYINRLIDEKRNFFVISEILKSLETYWFLESLFIAVSYLIKEYPEIITDSWINIKKIIKDNSNAFVSVYEDILNNCLKIFWQNNSKNAYLIAFWGYKILPFELIDRIIDKWVKYDSNYTYLSRNVKENKKPYYNKFIEWIYSAWEEAKFMFRDYLLLHPEVNSIIKKHCN